MVRGAMGVQVLLSACLVSGCTQGGDSLGPVPTSGTPELLSEWRLFERLPDLLPREGVVPYDVAHPLFTDYASKQRFFYLPEGTNIDYRDHGAWQFPVGAILIKHFSYPLDQERPDAGQHHVETRLLIHRPTGFEPEVYVWNEAQTDAVRDVSGTTVPMTRKLSNGENQSFEYSVPARSACRKCHGVAHPVEGALATRTLGPSTGQLNTLRDYGSGLENQIDHLSAQGWLDREPPPAQERVTFPGPDDLDAPLPERGRAYLAANCGHCHAPDGEVFDKELWLDWESTGPTGDPYHWGVCKRPTSAGNASCDDELDIVPGDPDSSLLLCRMELVGKGQMAPLGRNLQHAEGVELIRAWIAQLDLPDCHTPADAP